MKKILLNVIIFIMILGFLSGCVNAASVNINLKASKTNLNIGETVSITVSFSVPVSTVSLNLNYDNSKLEYLSDSIGGTNTGSSIRVDYIDLVNLKSISSITFTFKSKAEGTATCKVSGIVASDADANELSANVQNSATITIVDNTKKEEEKVETPSTPTAPVTPNEQNKPSTPTPSAKPTTSKKPNINTNTSTNNNKQEESKENEVPISENVIVEEVLPEKTEKVEAPNELLKLENEDGIITLKHEITSFMVKGLEIAIEDGTTLEVKEILKDNENYKKLHKILRKIKGEKLYFDIKLLKNDVLTEPNGYVTVFIPIPEEYKKENVQVYCLNEETKTYELIDGEIQDNYYTFTSNNFSKYALIEKAETKTVKQILKEIFTNITVLYVIIGILIIIIIALTIIIIIQKNTIKELLKKIPKKKKKIGGRNEKNM